MKTIFTLLFLSITSLCFGQNINGKEYRIFPRTDSVTIANIGKIAFDADDDKFRFNDGTGWYSFLKEGATLPYWPLSGNFSTTGNQTITMGGNITFNGGSARNFAASSMVDFNVSFSGVASILKPGSPSMLSNYLFFNTTGDIMIGKGVAGFTEQSIRFRGADSIIYVTDFLKGRGLVGGSDFSANYTDTSYVQKKYVDGKFDGIQVPEGANKTMGIATLSSGTITVNTTAVTANSRIFLTVNGGTLTNVGTPYISARVPSTSFTISSTNSSDASDVAWLIIEPAP